MIVFKSLIEGVAFRSLKRFSDARGWLCELFREDEPASDPKGAMAYISVTLPGVARGPHEHREQSDGFFFVSGAFDLYLWENREGHPPAFETHRVGEANPVFVVVPPGVVHAYRNCGASEAFVLNFPDRLYAGPDRSQPVDEIRHEEIDSPFRLP